MLSYRCQKFEAFEDFECEFPSMICSQIVLVCETGYFGVEMPRDT